MNFIELIIFILPAYIANSVPVLFGGGAPMDLGARFMDRNRLFGRGKTFRGFAAGVLAGVAASYVLANYFGAYYAPFLNASEKFAAGSLLAFGALVGDLAGSFVKRRLGLPRGYPSLFLDWLPFLLLALLFAYDYSPKVWDEIGILGLVFLVVFTIIAHVASNRAGYLLGLKKVPW
jgi:CDP-2,3-bis-(O-geranylgeranyl)-sn-glycerol synthase